MIEYHRDIMRGREGERERDDREREGDRERERGGGGERRKISQIKKEMNWL